MRAASLKEIKTELELQPQSVLLGLCLRLARFKKENKELLTYLLFEESNEAGYVESVKAEVDIAFLELNIKSLYIAKKNLRKILRSINRYIKYSGLKTTEATLLMHYCSSIKASGLAIEKSTQLSNIYASQIKKIKAAIDTMHEDLQYDYLKELKAIT
ncbi:MAG: hypothetical protein QM737_22340 [Ferruginibacter sp.]